GPGGIFIAYRTGAPGSSKVVLRKFDGAGWGPAVTLSETGDPRNHDLVEDQNGLLHFAWDDYTSILRYRRSTGPSNDTFSEPRTLVTIPGDYFHLRLAL